MAGSSTAGFWSYVHKDDEGGRGQIRRLATNLRTEYGNLTGEELDLFVDHDIEWGEQWSRRISRALQGATFFIPVITPRYFMSAACREELLKFRSEAARLGLEELLLPVYWISVPELDAGDPTDEAMALVASRQWEDLRQVRLVDETSSAYRVAVSRLAGKLVDIAERITQSASAAALAQPAAADAALAVDDDDSPGIVELLAEGEQAMSTIVEIFEAMVPIMERFGEIAEEATARMQAADARGAGFAGRLREAERFAAELALPAGEIERLGQRYAAELVKLDPAILTLIDAAAQADEDELEDAREFFEGIESLTTAAGGAIDLVSSFVASLDEVSGLSRGVRKPIRQIKSGLRGVIDGRALMDEWDRRIAEVSLAARDREPADQVPAAGEDDADASSETSSV